jgi:hypothetical protein
MTVYEVTIRTESGLTKEAVREQFEEQHPHDYIKSVEEVDDEE